MSVFFVECPKIPFWYVSSLNCCRRLFKICTSYIISKCRWIKINIPWFLVPYFYLLSVQSYKRLKLRAFKEWLFRKTNGRQIRIVITCGNVRSYFVSWKIYCLLVKKNRLYEQDRNSPHNIFANAAWKKMFFVEFIFAIPMF